MKVFKYLLLATFFPVVLISCRGEEFQNQPVHPVSDMDQQTRFEQQEKNEFFSDNRAMRQPVEGTIARGKLKKDKKYYQGINEDSSFVEENPVDVNKSFLYRGKDQFDVFCAPCHGIKGDGNGIIMANNYGFVPAPSFHIDRLRNVKDGYIYSVIANGIRNMPSYSHQISVKDQWAIVSYVRALQYSQNTSEKVVNEYDVDKDSLEQKYQTKMAAKKEQEEAQKGQGGGEVSVPRGKEIASAQACGSCHSVDGSEKVGPTWKNVFGHEVTLKDGSTVTVDEEYIRESIVKPNAKVVKGYPAAMPPYNQLSDSEINSLTAYIKSLSEKSE